MTLLVFGVASFASAWPCFCGEDCAHHAPAKAEAHVDEASPKVEKQAEHSCCSKGESASENIPTSPVETSDRGVPQDCDCSGTLKPSTAPIPARAILPTANAPVTFLPPLALAAMVCPSWTIDLSIETLPDESDALDSRVPGLSAFLVNCAFLC